MGVGEGRAAARIGTVADARRLARRRVPGPVWDYLEGGAGAEITLRANVDAFEHVEFRPRVAASEGTPARSDHLGAWYRSVDAPVAEPGRVHPHDGPRRGYCRRRGSRRGRHHRRRLSSHVGPHHRRSGRGDHGSGVVPALFPRRAPWCGATGRSGQTAGYKALVVTLDTPVPGNRERDLRHGLSPPLRLDRRTITKMVPRVLPHPRWLLDAARDRFQLDLVNASSLELDGEPMSAAEALLYWLAHAGSLGGLLLAARALGRTHRGEGRPHRRRRPPSRRRRG